MKSAFLLFGFAMALPLSAQVNITDRQDRIAIEISGKPFTELYYSGPSVWKPYLHPLRAATGTIVTRHFPMDAGEGETKDHPHHRGLWFGHGDVNGFDFWGNEPSANREKSGKIVMKKIGELKSGASSGFLVATFEWQDPKGNGLLTEQRRMTFYAGDQNRMVDFDITLDPLTKVTFGDTKEGTFAMRLAAGLEYPQKNSPADPPRTGTMVNSEGGEGEKQCWGKRANWMDYFGELKGEKVGIAILDHPGNPRHPTYWHTRAYGLFAANIFGVHDFTSNPSASGSMTIEPGHPLRFRYRLIIHPGDYRTANIAALYRQYK